METKRRTLLKAVLWNLIGLVIMSLVGLIMTGSAAIGGGIAAINTGFGLCCYVIYERIWAHIRWGREHV